MSGTERVGSASEGAMAIARVAIEAFLGGDLEALRSSVDPDLEWTFLDPSLENPQPATCRGREQLEAGVTKWSSMGLSSELEEIEGLDDKVLVVMHTPGLDRFRARNADDRNFHVLTVRDGYVTALRACRDREEASRLLRSNN